MSEGDPPWKQALATHAELDRTPAGSQRIALALSLARALDAAFESDARRDLVARRGSALDVAPHAAITMCAPDRRPRSR